MGKVSIWCLVQRILIIQCLLFFTKKVNCDNIMHLINNLIKWVGACWESTVQMKSPYHNRLKKQNNYKFFAVKLARHFKWSPSGVWCGQVLFSIIINDLDVEIKSEKMNGPPTLEWLIGLAEHTNFCSKGMMWPPSYSATFDFLAWMIKYFL